METSKDKLTNALISLSKSWSYSEINITMISQEANISRRTFYRHFKTKDEIVESKINGIFKRVLDENTNGEVSFRNLFSNLLVYVEKERYFFNLVFKSNLHNCFHSILLKYIELTNVYKADTLDKQGVRFISYFNTYHTYAVISLIEEWVKKNCKEDRSFVVETYAVIAYNKLNFTE